MENNTKKINILSEIIVNKIAAGEVIERPASVVKELIENAIDAEATKIDIHLEDSGKKLIKVTDNGVGMSIDDLSRAILSHSTSKLQKLDDIFSIKTLGFRGEALPSIGAISRVKILSRTNDSMSGGEIKVEGGNIGKVNEKGCAVGTQIEIRDLFFNTPVRKKFLKTNPIEMSHISETVTRISLSKPNIHFNLIHNGRTVFNLPNTSTIKERIITFFGNEIGKNLITINSKESNLVVKGYILPPAYDCRTTKMQYLFINSRYIRDKSILHAISMAYKGKLMSNRKPIVFLFLQMDPNDFDVNVHPTKIEVRFKNVSQIYSQIISSIKENLEQSEYVTPAKFDAISSLPEIPKEHRHEKIEPGESGRLSLEDPFNKQLNFPDLNRHDKHYAQNTFVETSRPADNSDNVTGRRCIQIRNAYIVEESSDGINIVDQHALHEIILYEEIKQSIKNTKLVSQQLLIPELVELSASDFFIIINLKDKLDRLGFTVEEFGKNTIVVRSYPQILKNLDCKEFIRNLLSEVDESICKEDVDECLDKLAKITSCKGAIKMGQKLKDQEIYALLEKRDKMSFSNNCPHGRPTSILMPFKELEKQFKRR
ncbi:MAG: DNA mismatch repair endonuclease MutL [Candidatus Anammoxibacter sp.]